MANIGTQAIAELVLRIKAENLAGAALSSLATNVRALPLVAAGAAAGMAVATAKMASDYQNMMTRVANNTTMGTSGLHAMDAAIRTIASQSPASLDSLAQGYMHIANFGFGAADATKILDAAQKSAVSTGGDVAQTANILANVLHEYGMGGQEAAHAMDVLHLAAAQGNMTLQQLVESGGRAIGMAANLHIPLTQVTAALSALTRHGETADVAGTYVTGMLSKIVNPTKAAREELTALSAQTGIDLLADFTPAGLQTKGLAGVLADLRAAHVDAAELFKIVPAQRGGLAAQILTGTGSTDYTTILASLGDTMAGKTSPTADAYARSQQTLAFQTGVLKNNLQELGITIGTALLPPLTKLVAAIVPIVAHITAWASAHGKLIATATPIFIVLSTIAGLALVAGPAVGLLAAAFSPLSLAVMAIVAAVGLLSVAWATNWGGIQHKVAAAWAVVGPVLGQLGQALRAVWDILSGNTRDLGGVTASLSAPFESAIARIAPALSSIHTMLSGLMGGISGLWSKGWKGLPPIVTDVWGILRAQLGVTWTALSGFFTVGLDMISGRWAAGWATLADTLKKVWDGIIGQLAPAEGKYLAALGGLLGRLLAWAAGTALPAIVTATGHWAGALWGWVQRVTPPLLGALGALLGRLGAWIGGTALPAIGAQLLRWATAFWQWVGPATATLISHLGPLLDRLGGWIGTTALPAIGAKLVEWGTAFWHWIVVALPLMEEKLGEFLGQMIVWIPTATIALAAKLLEWGAAFIGWLLPRWFDLLGKLNTFLGNIGIWIVTTALPALLKLGWDMGTQLIAGVVKGISDAAKHVHDAIQNALHGKTTPMGTHFTWGAPPHVTHPGTPAGAPPGSAALIAGATTINPWADAQDKRRQGIVSLPGAGDAAAGKDFAATLAAYTAQKGLDPTDIARMRADIALAAKTSTQQAKHLQDLLNVAVKHNHEAIRHRGALEEEKRRHGIVTVTGGGGTGSGGGLSPGTQAAIAAHTGKKPTQDAASDFSTAMALFKAQKGLDPTDIARMRADIAIIARSEPKKAEHLSALLGIAVKHNHEAIAHAGAVAAHHAHVVAHQRAQKAEHARQGAATDAIDHFKTDLLQLGATVRDHGRLLWDVNRVKALEIAAHVRGAKVALDFAANMDKVRKHFHEVAARAVAPYKQAAFDLAAGAGYGQTTVTMGPVRDQLIAQLQAQLRELKAQNAGQQKTIAALEAQLVELHRASGLLDGIFHNTAGTQQAAERTARHTQPRPTGGAHGFTQRTGMPVPV